MTRIVWNFLKIPIYFGLNRKFFFKKNTHQANFKLTFWPKLKIQNSAHYKTLLSWFVHVLKSWKGLEFTRHTQILKCEENWWEKWKKIVQITSNKIFETKNRTQAKFKKQKKICICLIFDHYCQNFISVWESKYEEMIPFNFEVFLIFSFSLRS